ncbi:MAG: hypothetical protein RLP44_10775 [Aggregatilineales bacterium]
MGQSPNPNFDGKSVSRIGLSGAVLGIVAIGLFVGLWVILGNANVDDFPRLIISVCVPPALMTAFLGVYILVMGGKNAE